MISPGWAGLCISISDSPIFLFLSWCLLGLGRFATFFFGFFRSFLAFPRCIGRFDGRRRR